LAGEHQGQTEKESADRHDRPGSPSVVQPARNWREAYEAKPAQRVSECNWTAPSRELCDDRDKKERKRGSRPHASALTVVDTPSTI